MTTPPCIPHTPFRKVNNDIIIPGQTFKMASIRPHTHVNMNTSIQSSEDSMSFMLEQLAQLAVRDLMSCLKYPGFTHMTETVEHVFGVVALPKTAPKDATAPATAAATTTPQSGYSSSIAKEKPYGELVFEVYKEIYAHKQYHAGFYQENKDRAASEFQRELVLALIEGRLPEVFREWAEQLVDDEDYPGASHTLELKRRGFGKDVINPYSKDHCNVMLRFKMHAHSV